MSVFNNTFAPYNPKEWKTSIKPRKFFAIGFSSDDGKNSKIAIAAAKHVFANQFIVHFCHTCGGLADKKHLKNAEKFGQQYARLMLANDFDAWSKNRLPQAWKGPDIVNGLVWTVEDAWKFLMERVASQCPYPVTCSIQTKSVLDGNCSEISSKSFKGNVAIARQLEASKEAKKLQNKAKRQAKKQSASASAEVAAVSDDSEQDANIAQLVEKEINAYNRLIGVVRIPRKPEKEQVESKVESKSSAGDLPTPDSLLPIKSASKKRKADQQPAGQEQQGPAKRAKTEHKKSVAPLTTESGDRYRPCPIICSNGKQCPLPNFSLDEFETCFSHRDFWELCKRCGLPMERIMHGGKQEHADERGCTLARDVRHECGLTLA